VIDKIGDRYLFELAVRAPRPGNPIAELEKVRDSAKALLDAAAAMGEEAHERLHDHIIRRPSDLGESYLLLRDSLDRLLRDGTAVFCAADDAIFGARAERPPRGRKRDEPARALVFALAEIWRQYTKKPLTRGGESRRSKANLGASVCSPWEEFVRTVLAIAGAEVKGDRLAREVAERLRSARSDRIHAVSKRAGAFSVRGNESP
jgi:hypothetical protein